MADTVRVVAVLRARVGSGAEVERLWPELSAQVHAEQGCLEYDLHRVAGDPDRFVVLERWASVEALAAHARTDHMVAFGRTAASLVAVPTEVTVLEDVPVA